MFLPSSFSTLLETASPYTPSARESSASFEDQTLADWEPLAPPSEDIQIIPNPPDTIALSQSAPSPSVELLDDEPTEAPKPPPPVDTVDFTLDDSSSEKSVIPALTVQQRLMVNNAIHCAKVSTAWMTAMPVLGPIVSLVNTAFLNQKKEATPPAELTEQQAQIQEAAVKKARWKALAVTAMPQVVSLGLLLAHQAMVEDILKAKKISLTDIKKVEHYFTTTSDVPVQHSRLLLGLALMVGLASFLVPLGYKWLERPEDPSFNKSL